MLTGYGKDEGDKCPVRLCLTRLSHAFTLPSSRFVLSELKTARSLCRMLKWCDITIILSYSFVASWLGSDVFWLLIKVKKNWLGSNLPPPRKLCLRTVSHLFTSTKKSCLRTVSQFFTSTKKICLRTVSQFFFFFLNKEFLGANFAFLFVSGKLNFFHNHGIFLWKDRRVYVS